MGKVIELPKVKEPEYCMVCGCGCQKFLLMFGGTVECEDCRSINSVVVWVHLPPEIRGV